MNQNRMPNIEQTDWRRQIEDLEEQGRQAFFDRDIERLRELWAEDLIVNSPLLRINNRDQVLDLLQRGVIRHYSYEVTIELIQRHGEMVIVMGRDVVTNTPEGPPASRRFTNLWYASGSSWLMVARHAQLTGSP